MGSLVEAQVLKACLFYAVAQALVFFQIHSQFIWKWWEGKPFHAALLYGLPAGVCFWYATKFAFEATGEVWGPRFLGFCMSYMTFPILAWYFMNETPFSPKTLLCIMLSFCIISIQLFWKTS